MELIKTTAEVPGSCEAATRSKVNAGYRVHCAVPCLESGLGCLEVQKKLLGAITLGTEIICARDKSLNIEAEAVYPPTTN